MSLKYAFLDFDGTLSKGYISMDFMDYLLEHDSFNEESYATQMRLLQDYKGNNIDYNTWLDLWAKHWGRGIAGHRVKSIGAHAKEFYRLFRPNIYTSSFELIRLLKKYGYTPLMISGGALEVASIAAEDLGIKRTLATTTEVRDELYTGIITSILHTERGKLDEINRISAEDEVDPGECAAFGDSLHDSPMLSAVGHPYCLNAQEPLAMLAKEKGWPVLTHWDVVERVSTDLKANI